MATMPQPQPAAESPIEQVEVALVKLTRSEREMLDKCTERVWIGAIAGSLFISAPVTGAMHLLMPVWVRRSRPNLSGKKIAGLSISTALLGAAFMTKYASEQCMEELWNLPEESEAGKTFRRIMKVNGYYRYSSLDPSTAGASKDRTQENKPLPNRPGGAS